VSRRRRRIVRDHRKKTTPPICPVGLHVIEFSGQACGQCFVSPLTDDQRRRLGAAKARFAERAAWRAVWSETP
jgi:hypothetical protein